LVEFIKDSPDYGIFIVESSVGGDDWLTDHDHIKELDQALATSGSNFLHLPYAGKLKHSSNFTSTVIDFFEGAGVDVSLGEGYWGFTVEGRYGGTSEADRNGKLEDILTMYNGHLLFANGALYLGYRKIGEVWEPFVNSNNTIKYYLKGKLLSAEAWRDAGQNYINWKITFRGVW
jgi:hypothetical protein